MQIALEFFPPRQQTLLNNSFQVQWTNATRDIFSYILRNRSSIESFLNILQHREFDEKKKNKNKKPAECQFQSWSTENRRTRISFQLFQVTFERFANAIFDIWHM